MAFFCHLLLPSCYNGPNVFSGSGWLTQVHCPLAVPFFLCAFPTVWLALRLRKAARTEHLCPTCKYDLTGNVSGRCPECGTVLAQGNEPQAAQPKKVSG